ncbi:MAG: DsbA family protein [Pseudomonadota bacterium]
MGKSFWLAAFGVLILGSAGLGIVASTWQAPERVEAAAADAPTMSTPGGTLSSSSLLAPDERADLSDVDRRALRAEIRSFLLEEPEVLMQAIRVLEQRQQMAAQEAVTASIRANAGPIFDDGFSYVGGNPEGSITLVEFIDYRCGFCKQAHREIAALLADDGDIRYVIKEYPILGPESMAAARAAMAVMMNEGPEVYFAFHDRLMTFGGRFTDAVLDRLASRSGADPEAMRATMERESDSITARLGQTQAIARLLEVSGTPTFIVGETVVRGYVPPERMQEIVSLARQVARTDG